jgi:hypothetical protein
MDYFEVGSTADSLYSHTNRNKLSLITQAHWAFGVYTLSDYMIKGTLLNAIMYGYRLVDGKFMAKEQFQAKYGTTE